MVKDPVCGMMLDENLAPATFAYGGELYYFCSARCLGEFSVGLEAFIQPRYQTERAIRVGTIARVHGPVVDIACEALPPLHRALFSRLDRETCTFEVHQHLDETHARAITLRRTAGLRWGTPVFDSGASLRVPVAPACLNRLLNCFGEPPPAASARPRGRPPPAGCSRCSSKRRSGQPPPCSGSAR